MNPVQPYTAMPAERSVRQHRKTVRKLKSYSLNRTEVKRILKEERVAIMCAYMLMHFLKDEDPFEFLN